jgi:hypothetical protein
LLFEVIYFVKNKKESNIFTRRWFSIWWKNINLHKIEIRLIIIV